MLSRAKLKLINFYYLITIIVYFSAIYLPFIRVGLSMSLIMGVGVFLLYKHKNIVLKNRLDMLVFAYLIYNIVSFFSFIISGLPIWSYLDSPRSIALIFLLIFYLIFTYSFTTPFLVCISELISPMMFSSHSPTPTYSTLHLLSAPPTQAYLLHSFSAPPPIPTYLMWVSR